MITEASSSSGGSEPGSCVAGPPDQASVAHKDSTPCVLLSLRISKVACARLGWLWKSLTSGEILPAKKNHSRAKIAGHRDSALSVTPSTKRVCYVRVRYVMLQCILRRFIKLYITGRAPMLAFKNRELCALAHCMLYDGIDLVESGVCVWW